LLYLPVGLAGRKSNEARSYIGKRTPRQPNQTRQQDKNKDIPKKNKAKTRTRNKNKTTTRQDNKTTRQQQGQSKTRKVKTQTKNRTGTREQDNKPTTRTDKKIKVTKLTNQNCFGKK
jgi:hypothetical protein